MKKFISLIACFSIAVFAQDGQYQPPPPSQQYQPPQGQYPYPPQQQYQPPQGQYPYPPQQQYQPPQGQYPYPPPPYAYPPPKDNFSVGQRWGTFGLNVLVPGLGSYVIMKDVLGGIVQDVLWIGGTIMLLSFSPNGEDYDETTDLSGLFYVGLGMTGVSFIFNIVRSITYDKPKGKVASTIKDNDGFKVAVLPNNRGKIMPYFFYSKAF